MAKQNRRETECPEWGSVNQLDTQSFSFWERQLVKQVGQIWPTLVSHWLFIFKYLIFFFMFLFDLKKKKEPFWLFITFYWKKFHTMYFGHVFPFTSFSQIPSTSLLTQPYVFSLLKKKNQDKKKPKQIKTKQKVREKISLSLFYVSQLLLAWGLHFVVGIPSETPLERTSFPFTRVHQLQRVSC